MFVFIHDHKRTYTRTLPDHIYLVKPVQRTLDFLHPLSPDVRVSLRRPNASMPTQLLNVPQVSPTFQQMRRERVPQRLDGCFGVDPPILPGASKDALRTLLLRLQLPDENQVQDQCAYRGDSYRRARSHAALPASLLLNVLHSFHALKVGILCPQRRFVHLSRGQHHTVCHRQLQLRRNLGRSQC
jgi:hypothetical protein